MKPVIGLVADVVSERDHIAHAVHASYLDAISGGAGALPVILPALVGTDGALTDPADLDQALDLIDGLFLPGATSNVDPAHYGDTQQDPNSPADPARDHVSLALIRRAVARGIPVLGVCRGLQELNVALGGTLHQAVHDAPGHDDHRENPDLPVPAQYAPVHEVRLVAGGLLHRLAGAATTRVNSLHGQGVRRLAPSLHPEAHAPDGLIEAVGWQGDGFVLGVQWHPEWLFRTDPVSKAIFAAFGEAAKARAVRPGPD